MPLQQLPMVMPEIGDIYEPARKAQEFQQQQNALRREQAIRNALAQSIDPRTGKLDMSAAYTAGGQEIAPDLFNLQRDLRTQDVELALKGAQTQKHLSDVDKQWLEQNYRYLGSLIGRPDEEIAPIYSQWRANTIARTPEAAPLLPEIGNNQVIQRLMQDAKDLHPEIDFNLTSEGLEGIDTNPQSRTYGQTVIKRGAPPKSPGVSIDLGEKGNLEATKLGLGRLYDAYDKLQGAPELWQSMEEAKSLVGPQSKKFMGTGGEPLLEAVNFLNSRFGTDINVQGVTDASRIRSLMFQGVLENLRKLDAQPSQQQQFALQQALGSIGTDPNALIKIIEWSQQQLEQRVDRYNKNASTASKKFDLPYDIGIQMPTRSTSGATAGGPPKPPPGFKVKIK